MNRNLVIRPALPGDRPALLALTDSAPYLHRHLDWRPALEWLGAPLFWLAEQSGEILAALACPVDPPGVSWIRLFAARDNRGYEPASLFQNLFLKAVEEGRQYGEPFYAAISLYPWFGSLLTASGFHHHQEIVVLEWDDIPPAAPPLPAGLHIRPMQPGDLADVVRVDNLAFGLLWQHSLDGITLARQQSAYSTVALSGEQIVGYQISTAVPFSAHLARLAVLPEFQHHSIGAALVRDVLDHFWQEDLLHVSVNTQADNHHSLALYQKLGFMLTGDAFDVYAYP